MLLYQQAIVLKSFYPQKHTLSLLTKAHGKIKITVLNSQKMHQVQSGSIIDFYSRNSLVKDLTILTIPFFKNINELYWIHHLLELCYYFIPLHHDCFFEFIVVDLSLLLCNNENITYNKNIITGLLLLMFGFYPPQSLSFLFTLKKILSLCIDFMPHEKIEFLVQHLRSLDQKQEDELKEWILECIESHPRNNIFKTVNFMYQFD